MRRRPCAARMVRRDEREEPRARRYAWGTRGHLRFVDVASLRHWLVNYSEVDWVRTIRHGIKPDPHPMILMPSADYNQLTNVDLAALIACVRSLPPETGEGDVIRLPLIVRALY